MYLDSSKLVHSGASGFRRDARVHYGREEGYCAHHRVTSFAEGDWLVRERTEDAAWLKHKSLYYYYIIIYYLLILLNNILY